MKAWTKCAALALAALITLTAAGCAKQESAPEPSEEESTKKNLVIGYAEEGVTVAQDKDSLLKGVKKMLEAAAEPGIPLTYKNDAYSEDGINFSCYIENANVKYDLFLQIFADEELQDEVFLSQLIRPGQAFESLSLSHPLPKGEVTRCYVSLTRVELVDGEQTIHDQTFFTMDFHVQ